MQLDTGIKSIFWMTANCFFVAVQAIIIQHLMADMGSFIIVALRNIFSFILMVIWLLATGAGFPATKRIKLFVARSGTGIASMFLWTYAIAFTLLADVTALSFTVPLFTAVLAVLLLREKITIHRCLALVGGFAGVLIIVQPGSVVGVNLYGSFLVILSAALAAIMNIMIKKLTETETAEAISFYTWLIMAVLCLPIAVIFWQPVNLEQFLWLIALAVASNLMMFCWSYAYAKAELVVLMPIDFSRLVFVAIMAFIFFGQELSLWTTIGSIVIIASAVYDAKYYRKLSKVS